MGDESDSQTSAPPQRAKLSHQLASRANAGTSGRQVSGVGRPEGWSFANVAGKPGVAPIEGQQDMAKLVPMLQTQKSAEGTGQSLQANSRASAKPASTAPARSGTGDTATSDRLARLAQQRQRLAEQRARLAAGRSASSQLTGQPLSAAGSSPAERPTPVALPPATVGRHQSASVGETPLPAAPKDRFIERTMQRAADSFYSNGSQISGKSLAAPSGQLLQDGLHSKPAVREGVTATGEDPPGIVEEQMEGPKGKEAAASSIPFGLASSGGSCGDFFRGGVGPQVGDGWCVKAPFGTECADESSGAEVASETHGAGSDSYHGVAPADIPFGGTNDRPEREPDAAFGVEQENTSQLFGSSIRTASTPSEPSTRQASSEGRRVGGAFSAGQEPQLNGGLPGNDVYDNSSCQASDEWSHKPHWGSSSSLSTHPPPQQQVPRLGHISRNPSWGSSEHMSISSTAARPQPPIMSQPAVPAWDAQSQPPPWQSHAVAPKAAGHWDDPTDNGADFFANSPVAPVQEPGGIVGDGLRPQQGQAVGSDSLETEPVAETLPAPQFSCVEQQGQEQPSPFAAGSVQQQEFPWEGPQMQPDHYDAALAPSSNQWGNQGAAGHSAAWGYEEPASHGWATSEDANGYGRHEMEEPSFSGYGGGDTHPSHGHAASDPAWTGQPGGYGHHWQRTAQSYGAQAWEAQVQANASELPRTAEQARRCPSGRPPIPLVAFGFGGRVVAMRPRLAPVMSSVGELALGPLEILKTERLATALGHAHQSELTGGVTPDHDPQLLRSFPGVLTSSTTKTKVLDFVANREAGAEEESSTEKETAIVKLLWAVIRLLIQNKGSLKSAPDGGGQGKAAQPSAEKQLAKLLEEGGGAGKSQPAYGFGSAPEQGAWAQGGLLLEQSTSSSAAAEDAAQRMQDLLQQGEQPAALKVAVDAHLWGPALLLAKLSGGSAFDETAGAMTSSYLRPGTPLQTLLSTASAQPAVQQQQQQGEESAGAVEKWRACLAVLALNSRGPSGEAAMVQLGDRLYSQNTRAVLQVLAAHVCYLVAGVVPLAYDPTARLCLPGADHRRQPRVFASVAAIQRGLLLEWARLQGHGANPQSAAAMLPYRLILAARLAEYGYVEAASQQTAGVTAALNGLGGRLPGGLLVVRSLANELQLRLQTHAQAFNINISRAAGGSLMTKAGKWLDKSLSKLIGVGELPEGVQPPEGKPPQQSHHRPRSFSQPASPRAETHRRVSSAVDMGGAGSRPQTPQNLPTPSAPASAAASPTPSITSQAAGAERASSLSVRGLIGKVGSFTSLLGATAAPNKREAELGSENSLYYDNELKMWREHGKPPPEPQLPQQPPPTLTAGLAPPPGTDGDGKRAGGRTERVRPAGPAQEGQCPTAQASGVRSRYVDTIASSSRQPSAAALPKPSGIIPRPAFFTPTGAARPALPNFFTPAVGGQNPSVGQEAWARQPSVEPAPSAEQQYGSAAVKHPWGPPSGSGFLAQSAGSSQEALEEMTEVTL